MRYFFIFILLIHSLLAKDNLSLRLDKLLQDKSIKKIVILKYNPFNIKIQANNNKKVDNQTKVLKRKKMKLISLFDNRAFVDNRWIKKNDIIRGYRVIEIKNNRVVLYKNGKKVFLRFKNKNILTIRKK